MGVQGTSHDVKNLATEIKPEGFTPKPKSKAAKSKKAKNVKSTKKRKFSKKKGKSVKKVVTEVVAEEKENV